MTGRYDTIDQHAARVADALPDDAAAAATILAGLLALSVRVLGHELGDLEAAREHAMDIFRETLALSTPIEEARR